MTHAVYTHVGRKALVCVPRSRLVIWYYFWSSVVRSLGEKQTYWHSAGALAL